MYIKYRDKKKIYKLIFYKLFRFYVNYWTVFLIFIPIGVFMKKYSFNFKYILLNFIGLKSTYNGEWWFIRLYVMLILLYPLFTFFINKFNTYMILSVSFIINILGFGITKFLIISKNNYIILDLISILLGGQFLFILGICIAKYAVFNKITEKLKFKKIQYVISCILLSILIGILVNVSIVGEISKLILVPFLCFTIANSLEDNNSLSKFGKYSTNMWLTHSFFIYYLFQDTTFKFKYSILILLWTIFISMLCSSIINKIVKIELRLIKI